MVEISQIERFNLKEEERRTLFEMPSADPVDAFIPVLLGNGSAGTIVRGKPMSISPTSCRSPVEHETRNAQLSARVRQLEEQFRLAQLKRYAPSSEKRSERVFNEAEQMGPESQADAVALPDTDLPEAAPPVPQKRGRKPLPADLPRKRVEHDIPEEQRICACCQGALHCIGEDVSEQLHIPPATPWVWQHVRFIFRWRINR
jgi:hypothetical protein